MRMCWSAIALLTALTGVASPALAQSSEQMPAASARVASRTPLSGAEFLAVADRSGADAADRETELKRWMDDFKSWKEWSAKWSNRRERGWFTSFRDRREKPAPPAWLTDECAAILDDADPLMAACALLTEWGEDYGTAQIRLSRAAAVAKIEDTSKTVWWEHVHLDMLWPAMQWRASVYGVVGMHVATTVKGRLQVFIAPGAMFLNLPTRNGERAWKLATNYGIGFSLFEFNLPRNRRAVLHLNLAKAWLLSDNIDLVTGRSMDFAGFSVAFKKTH